jgi:DNA-binding MarR family transcriptional regulator
VPAPSLTRLVDRMATDGLVHRTVDARDRRRVLVHLTRQGRALHRCATALVEQQGHACWRTPGRRTCGACRSCSRPSPAGSAERARAHERGAHRRSFAITVDGRAADLDAVLPGFTERDRVGVVVRRPLGGAGASLLVLAAVTGFYEEQRRRGEPFFIYPDYFVFHAGGRWATTGSSTFWPPTRRSWWRTSRRRSCGRSTTGDHAAGGGGRRAATATARRSSRGRRSRARAGGSRRASPTPRRPRPGRGISDRRQRGHGALRDRHGGAVRRRGVRGAGRREARRDLVRNGRPVETYRAIALDEALARLG